MARTTLRERTYIANEMINEGEASNLPDLVDAGHRLLSSVDIARAAMVERQAEQGKIGRFPIGTPSREIREHRKRAAVLVGEVGQLPVVASGKYPCPNVVLRSALFAVVRKGMRKGLTRQPIVSEPGFEILFTGTQLDQADLDVWLHCLKLSANGLGQAVTVTAYDFVTAIGRKWGSGAVEWLKDALARLGAAAISVRTSNGEFMVHERMVTYDALGQGDLSILRFGVPAGMVALFGLFSWTGLVIEMRSKLRGKPLAQWLVGFYSTHGKPIPVPVEALRRLSGSSTDSDLAKFRQTLKTALNAVTTAGFLKSWSINDSDRVSVVRARHSTKPIPGQEE